MVVWWLELIRALPLVRVDLFVGLFCWRLRAGVLPDPRASHSIDDATHATHAALIRARCRCLHCQPSVGQAHSCS